MRSFIWQIDRQVSVGSRSAGSQVKKCRSTVSQLSVVCQSGVGWVKAQRSKECRSFISNNCRSFILLSHRHLTDIPLTRPTPDWQGVIHSFDPTDSQLTLIRVSYRCHTFLWPVRHPTDSAIRVSYGCHTFLWPDQQPDRQPTDSVSRVSVVYLANWRHFQRVSTLVYREGNKKNTHFLSEMNETNSDFRVVYSCLHLHICLVYLNFFLFKI